MKHEERRSGEEERRRRVISSPTTSSVTGIPSSSRAMDIVLERNSDAPSSSPLFFSFFFTVLSLPFLFSNFYVLWIGPYKCGAILQAARTIYMFTIARRDERRNYNIPPLERMVADNIDPDGPFLSNVYTSNILENTWGYPGLLKNGLLGLNLCHEERDKLI